jgi:hypothetical protein
MVRDELNARRPGLVESRRRQSALSDLWLDIMGGADDHLFREVREAGWIEAAQYYSSRDPRSELIWRQRESSADD